MAKAPLASDLRFVTVAMKISQNLERVGDEATKIAKRARDLSQEAEVKATVDLPRLAGLALDMLKRALDSFVHRDPAAARQIIPRDKEVDDFNKEIEGAIEFAENSPFPEPVECLDHVYSFSIRDRELNRKTWTPKY